jgi:hypothetical protein
MIRKILTLAVIPAAAITLAAAPAMAGTGPGIYYHIAPARAALSVTPCGESAQGASATAITAGLNATLTAPTQYSSYKAGYQAHGRDRVFRNVKSTFTLPATDAAHGCDWRIYDQLSSGGHQLDVEIHPVASNTYVAGYRIDGVFTVIPLGAVLSPGDTIQMSVYFDVHGDRLADYTVADLTTSAKNAVVDIPRPRNADGSVMGKIRYAEWVVHPDGPVACIPATIATDCFTHAFVHETAISMTTYSGHHDDLVGTVPVAYLNQTDNGQADGDPFASGGVPTLGGSAATIFMRG